MAAGWWLNVVADTAARYAIQRPELDEVFRLAIEDRHATAATEARRIRVREAEAPSAK